MRARSEMRPMGPSRASFLLLVLAGLLTIRAQAQSYTGTVMDAGTDAPLPGVTVYFVELETGTTTDALGVFRIEHGPHKTIRVELSFMGYRSVAQVIDLATEMSGRFALERSHLELKELVVSIPSGKLQRENVVNVAQRRMEELRQVPTATLAEAITNIAGVERNATGTGIGKPVIRGLSGNRIVTYAQGIRIENQQWGEEHGLGVGDAGIESVEAIKGPASVLYGSDALGGVLYFVDERYAAHNTVEARAGSRFLVNSLGSSSDLGVKLHQGRFKLNLFGNYGSNADYQVPNGDRVTNTRFDERTFKTSIGFDHKNWIANVRYGFLGNDYGITDSARYGRSTARPAELPFQSIGNHAVSVENSLFTGRSKLNLVLGHTANQRREYEEDAAQPGLDMDLRTSTYNLKWYSPEFRPGLKVIIGSQGMLQTNTNHGPELLIPNATTEDIGAFGLLDMTLGPIQLQGGLRADQRTIDAQATSSDEIDLPALRRVFTNINYSAGAAHVAEHATYRLNVSSGFRAPTTSELLSNGVHEGTNRFERGTPDLDVEHATQVDLSFEHRDEHFNFSVNPYVSSIRNYIQLAPNGTEVDGDPVFTYGRTNATLYGGEAGIHYHPHGIHWLHIESNYSMVLAENGSGDALPLIPSPRLNSTVKVSFDRRHRVGLKEVFVQHIHKFAQDRPGALETATSAYDLLNAGIELAIGKGPRPTAVIAGVKNLLNAAYIDHLSRFKVLGIPDQGRGFYVGLSMAIDRPLGRKRHASNPAQHP